MERFKAFASKSWDLAKKTGKFSVKQWDKIPGAIQLGLLCAGCVISGVYF